MRKYIMMIVFCLFACFSAIATTNEIQVTIIFDASKNSSQVNRNPGSIYAQWVGTKYATQVYSLTTTNQAISTGGIVTPGWTYFRNVGTTGTANISFDRGATTNMTLLAGQPSLIKMADNMVITNIQVFASSGTAELEVTIVEK